MVIEIGQHQEIFKKMKKKIIVICGGGHGIACVDVIEKSKKYIIKGFVDSKKKSKNDLNGYKYLGDDKNLKKLRKNYKYALNGAGQIRNNTLRKKIFFKLKKNKFETPTIFSPNSIISKSAKLDEGTIIMHGVIINSKVNIGKNCIVNSKALIEHNVTIEEHCHISTGAIINGNTTIKKNSFIGSGSIVGNGIKIGKNCIISAGSVITKDIKDGTFYKKK
jgi:sugar O-acyltransferase (sialic acid O-acetyltransferase NeuD family)